MWLCAAVAGIALAVAPAHAEPVQAPATATTTESGKFSFSQYLPADRIAEHAAAAADAVTDLVDSGLSLLGVRYRFGGNTPQSGFDCSGFVRHVFSDALGVLLPRTAVEMARVGETVPKEELQPGDLVFFNTLRRSFSHVGIYLGNNKFMHANSRGGGVRVDDMTGRYWAKRFNGARRIEVDDTSGMSLR
ncbi:NLP/P60 protein [Methyloversatilis universalis FAM5]|uniref:NLP/P60 protein n=1 Tax=Methyloversatilis universalis (strain ATCC BAA-1314 / DSM 25237 / JCM 13912 / CCUG 52030 / FAM5) TaxID=1000565 RepID=F5R8V6_METUF|nr:NLP/P60 protein [Methyloversatilis universalis FAM5]